MQENDKKTVADFLGSQQRLGRRLKKDASIGLSNGAVARALEIGPLSPAWPSTYPRIGMRSSEQFSAACCLMIQTREEEDHARTLMFIDFHLVVPGSMSVSAAHDICDRLERAVKEEFADARS